MIKFQSDGLKVVFVGLLILMIAWENGHDLIYTLVLIQSTKKD